jgi:CopG family nickel-responsive transcriptional regulator
MLKPSPPGSSSAAATDPNFFTAVLIPLDSPLSILFKEKGSSNLFNEGEMSIVRFSVSLDKALVDEFDQKIQREQCPTRSKAVGDLIRDSLVQTEWQAGKEVVGAIVLVYDHHKSDIVQRLTKVQHDCHDAIISTQHIHLDHDNCIEIVAVRGKPPGIESILKRLKAVKGLKHVSLASGTTGVRLP